MFRPWLYKTFGLLGFKEANKFELATFDPQKTQLEKLNLILSQNHSSRYGTEHNFSKIKTISQFQKAVPISSYETLSPYIDLIAAGAQNVLTTESPFMFATTSGTTGARKLIPITRSYVREFRAASVVSGYHLLEHFPAVASGVTVSVVSPAEEGRTGAGIPFGAISGRLFIEEPWLIRQFISPIPYEVFLIKDYETRYYTLIRCALTLPVSCFYSLNPSTLVLLARKMEQYKKELLNDVLTSTINPPQTLPRIVQEKISKFLSASPERIAHLRRLQAQERFAPEHIWPSLSLICCWTKAAASFYLEDLKRFLGSVPICDITYGASEGRGTVSLSPHKQALAIRSHFFEFIPEDQLDRSNPSVFLANELEEGKSYYILFTTSAGLYRYNINDVVKVVGFHNRTPLIEFQHKGGNIFSFTGEKITESQVTQAMMRTAQSLNVKIRFFSVVPEFGVEPQYQLFIEIPDEEPTLLSSISDKQLEDEFDRHLCLLNIEYQSKRDSGRLAPVTVRHLRSGFYDTVRQTLSEQGIPDAQVKVSHLNPKQEIKDLLRSFLRNGM